MTCELCSKPVEARGLCVAHYNQALRGKIPMPPKRRKTATVCTVCGDREYAKGFCHRHYMQDYARLNANTIRDRQSQYRQDNRAEILRSKLNYRQSNKEALAESGRLRRARMYGAGHEVFSESDMLDRWGTDCYLCGEPIDIGAPKRSPFPGWELSLWRDHVISLADGGSDSLDNVRPSHALCNLRKGRRPAILVP